MPRKTLPITDDLPSEDLEDPGLPDEVQLLPVPGTCTTIRPIQVGTNPN